ncbi:MAG: hypothetical protein C4321_03850, partial [Chloroflexota bacterium]
TGLIDILGHPTGRLLGSRDPMPLDLEAIFVAAARAGTAMEINASADRLDLNDVNAHTALKHGLMLSINSDAHSPTMLDTWDLGLLMARRAW